MNDSDLRITAGVRRGAKVRLHFDGRTVDAFEGESVAAALWSSGVRAWHAEPDAAGPPPRTLSCAMGVCQQCALWIDGRRVESCRVPASEGLDVRTRYAPNARARSATRGERTVDVAVLGAGPAGASAAIEAAALGLSVVVLDENPAAGGQVYRIAPGIAPLERGHDRDDGDALRAGLAQANADLRQATRVWLVERVDEEWRVHAIGPDGALTVRAAALVVATGALERHLPFEGWDRPGVIGLAAATILLKAQRTLPGRAVVVAGVGPLLAVVAKSIVEAGGRVVAVVDANPRHAWLASPLALASRPDLVARGLGWMRTLRKHRVRMLHGHALQRVDAQGGALRAVAAPVERNGAARANGRTVALDCDAVCCGSGLMPATDVTRLAGATHVYDADRGGWHARVDDDQRSDRPRLYVAGDGAGVVGASAAPWQGRIAAMAAAYDLGRIDARAYAARSAQAKRARARAARFGSAMTRLARIGDGAIAAIAPGVTVCRCEHLTRATLDAAIDAGAASLDDLKTATRCGMGPCGGRVCEDAASRLLALRIGCPRAEVGQVTGRPPLRPVDIDTLAGEFDYDALPIAAPSPL